MTDAHARDDEDDLAPDEFWFDRAIRWGPYRVETHYTFEDGRREHRFAIIDLTDGAPHRLTIMGSEIKPLIRLLRLVAAQADRDNGTEHPDDIIETLLCLLREGIEPDPELDRLMGPFDAECERHNERLAERHQEEFLS